ncbi:MAG: hypothetical protein JWO31_4034 [Phycisphaerales bacterium]|nr:hypothetical protein [Phycisphaerales bacterium]
MTTLPPNPPPAPPTSLEISRLRRRLRLAAFGVAVFVVTLAAGLHAAGPATSPVGRGFGDDLVPSYMAGTFVRLGRADLLMDPAAAEWFQADLRRSAGLEQHGRTGPWLNPPFFAWLFVPLSALPYWAALWTWFGLNATMLAASVGLLYRLLPAGRRAVGDAAAIALLVLASMPCLQALACQQNTFLSLLILTGAVTLARADRSVAAGAVAGLLVFKPQLAVIVCGALAVTAGRRAVVGTALTVLALLLATVIAMPGALSDYFARLPTVLPYLRTDRPYFWDRQATFLGFWRLLLGGRTGGPNPPVVTLLWLSGAAAVAVGLVRLVRAAGRLAAGSADRDGLLAAAVVAAPLLMPYYMDYDLLLLAVPATLFGSARLRDGRRPGDRLAVLVWVATYAWLYVNAAAADATRVSVTVLLLAALMAVTVWRGRAGVPLIRNEARPNQPKTVGTSVPLEPAARRAA